jgi:hypothetical protein
MILIILIFPSKYNRYFGLKLFNIPSNIRYKIIYFKKPANIYDVNYKNIVENLNNEKIDEDDETNKILLKFIVNYTTGNLERKYNKNSYTSIFYDKEDAQRYAKIFMTNVKVINNLSNKLNKIDGLDDLDIIYDDISYMDNSLKNIEIKMNNFEEKKLDTVPETEINKELYLVSIQNKRELSETFKYIKELIYTYSHIKIINTYIKMKENDNRVLNEDLIGLFCKKSNMGKDRA